MSRSDTILKQAPLVTLYVVLGALVVQATDLPAQDFVPFWVAAEAAVGGDTSSVMLPPNAAHLMDSDPAFLERSMEVSGLGANVSTGFVAPPSSIVPVLPFTAVSATVASTLWRLGLLALVVGTLHSLNRTVQRDEPENSLMWTAITIALAPACLYALLLGQTSPILWAAAWFGLRAAPAAGVLVGLAASFKLAPALLLLFAPRRVAAVAAATITVLLVLSLGLVPVSLWADFFATSGALGSQITTAINNVSAGAIAQRLQYGTDPLFQAPTWLAALATWVARLTSLGIAALLAWKRPGSRGSWQAGWIATLSLSPLLWTHYLPVLVVLLSRAAPLRVLPVALLIGAAHAGLILDLPLPIAELASVAWGLGAGLVLIEAVREADA